MFDFNVSTVNLCGLEPNKFVIWAGAFIQDPYRDLLIIRKEHYHGVYIGRYFLGSPAEFYQLRAHCWISEINGIKTPDLDSFIKAVSNCDPDSFIRVTIIGLSDKERLITLKPNTRFWPTVQFELRDNAWHKTLFE